MATETEAKIGPISLTLVLPWSGLWALGPKMNEIDFDPVACRHPLKLCTAACRHPLMFSNIQLSTESCDVTHSLSLCTAWPNQPCRYGTDISLSLMLIS